jgi:hypothetical protein
MTKIKPTYVTFEQAKLFKNKGADAISFKYYDNGGTLCHSNTVVSNKMGLVVALEQWQVVEWLRVNHGIWVFVGADAFNEKKFWGSVLNLTTDKNKQTRFCSTPQEAYSAAFDYIKDNNLI